MPSRCCSQAVAIADVALLKYFVVKLKPPKVVSFPPVRQLGRHKRIFLSLSELPITLTEESAMAAAAITGESRMPKKG
jgi:hypothetical protein